MKQHLLLLYFLTRAFVASVEIYDSLEEGGLQPLEFGSRDEVVLNCDYDLREDERGQLDIKWYFNDDVVPFLQWIPGGDRRPQLIGPTHFRGHVDLDYRVDEDEHKAFRSLKILQPTLAMAGNYRCKVSTFEDEGYVQHQLLIYVPPKKVELQHSVDEEGNLNITCLVEEVFPQPHVQLLWNESKLENAQYNIQEREQDGGLLDITLRYYHHAASASASAAAEASNSLERSNHEERKLEEADFAASGDGNTWPPDETLGTPNIVNLGCHMELPKPLDIVIFRSLNVDLVAPEDEEGSGSGDSCLFCQEDGSGNSSTLDYESSGAGEIDYDNDWLNIYNETLAEEESEEEEESEDISKAPRSSLMSPFYQTSLTALLLFWILE